MGVGCMLFGETDPHPACPPARPLPTRPAQPRRLAEVRAAHYPFQADSAYLVTASSDLTAKLWDVQSGDVIRHYTGQMAMTCVALNDSS